MLKMLDGTKRREQTLASFDYQWRHLASGDYMLSDPWFVDHCVEILEEITGVSRGWFAGKKVLDAGCGGGRWTAALLRAGAVVTAVDYSQGALDQTRSACEHLGWLETLQANLLELPSELAGRRFDMVFSFGVLHHTGDTMRALANIVSLVADRGLLFLYLYGAQSWSWRKHFGKTWIRWRLASMPFDAKVKWLEQKFPRQDINQVFDCHSPVINERLTFEQVAGALAAHGCTNTIQTVASTELFIRSQKSAFDEPESLAKSTQARSMLMDRAASVEAVKRDQSFEYRLWSLAAVAPLSRPAAERSVAAILKRLDCSLDSVRDKSVLVVSPDSDAAMRELVAAGADVTCMSPLPESLPPGLPVRYLHAGTLDEVDADDSFDWIFVLGSAISISRRPELAVERAVARLANHGSLVMETLAPKRRSPAQTLLRRSLGLLPFDRKIATVRALRAPIALDEAMATLWPTWPRRFGEHELANLCRQAGVNVTSSAGHDGCTLVLAQAD